MGVAVLLILSAVGLLWLAQSRTNHVALSSKPKPVSVVLARSTTFRPSRRYIGTLEAWVSSNIGPQIISAYIDTVLVRPGAKVKRGSVLATLDCRNASAASRAVAAQARAIEAKQKALSHEAARTRGLLDGGFVSPNEAEQKSAQSSAEEAQLAAELERVAKTTLEVSDCVLRAPFDGEVATRSMDPGAYARPGSTIVTVVDRNTVRMRADVPESDFDFVSPGVEANVLVFATGQTLQTKITRRAPAADPNTRTILFEIDIADPERRIPVGTTGEVSIDVGESHPAIEVPLNATNIERSRATLMVVEQGRATQRVFEVLGERGGSVFLAPGLKAGSRIVLEGRGLLQNGDRVQTRVES